MYILGIAVLIVLALLWILEIFKRFGRDVNELREGDWTSKLSVVVMWIVTVFIVGFLGWMVWRVVDRILIYF